VDQKTRSDLVQKGQRPMAIILGCADSRVAIDYVFDTNPGDLFVLRNAGAVCGKTTGGLIGSIEYGVDHLKSQLIVVLGHTHCGAVSAALNSSGKSAPTVSAALKTLLTLIEKPVEKAIKEGKNISPEDLLNLAIKLNVWHTIEQLIKHSDVLKDALARGDLQVQGAVYDLQSGRVNFMGQHPQQHNIVLEADSDSEPIPGNAAKSKVSTEATINVVPGNNDKKIAWGDPTKDVEKGGENGQRRCRTCCGCCRRAR
jgi:carbonic anhydrase